MNTPGGHSYAYLYLNFTYRNRLITHFNIERQLVYVFKKIVLNPPAIS